MKSRLGVAAFALLAVLSLTIGQRLAAGGGARPAPAPAVRGTSAAHLFTCGELQCDARETYCETINTDVPILPSNHACRPLPAACVKGAGATPTCLCFPRGTRGDYCGVGEAKGLPAFYRTTFGGR